MEKHEKSLGNVLTVYEDLNEKYDKIVNGNIDNFNEIKNLLESLKDSKNNSTELLEKNLCNGISICSRYIKSPYNLLGTGVDFLYKSLLIDISKTYLDYKGLKDEDKKDINKMKNLIITEKFISIGLFIEYGFYYVKSGLFNAFKSDEENFKNKIIYNLDYLNIITVIYSIFIFLFVVVFIFITIAMYADPIKKAAYRISCSFYYIKIYNFYNYRKSN